MLKQFGPTLAGLVVGVLPGSVLGRRRRLVDVVAFVPWPPESRAYR
jgi:hypothetical protein